MKHIINLIIILIFILKFISSCKTAKHIESFELYQDSVAIHSQNDLLFTFEKGQYFNHPTFVIWQEDLQGNYQKTLFITKSYATGIFRHEMRGDTAWLETPGKSIQEAALPFWTHKKGLIEGKYLIPEPEHPFVDAYSGATPKGSFKYETNNKIQTNTYKIFIEINQTWDWNKYWTNNKYPESFAYKHSAQPSLIYSAEINESDSTYFFQTIGHGDPNGSSGDLFPDLSTLTTAKEIFKQIKVELK